jgi:putative membrane protein
MIVTSEPKTDPRIYLAAERTFLAWMRTGVALMGFGFVIARFGLFLRELAEASSPQKIHQNHFSTPAGVVLIVMGVLVITISAIRHHYLIRAIDRGQFQEAFGSNLALSVVGLLSAIGICVAIYLATL